MSSFKSSENIQKKDGGPIYWTYSYLVLNDMYVGDIFVSKFFTLDNIT